MKDYLEINHQLIQRLIEDIHHLQKKVVPLPLAQKASHKRAGQAFLEELFHRYDLLFSGYIRMHGGRLPTGDFLPLYLHLQWSNCLDGFKSRKKRKKAPN